MTSSLAKSKIQTDKAPIPLGTYSQAIRTHSSGHTVYLSGQISADTSIDFRSQAKAVFSNLSEVAKAAGGSLDHIVKLTVFLMDFSNFPIINELMTELFTAPYPARSTIQVSALPKGAQVEIEAVMMISD